MGAADLAGLVRESGRSWWEARYSNGHVVREWEVASPAGFMPYLVEGGRWDELDPDGLIGIRLLCPDGSIAELGARADHRVFQFKVGGLTASVGHQVRWCSAHVIGAVVDTSGRCVCRAWETGERRLIAFEDNVFRMQYRSVGPLALENIGVGL